MQEIAYAKINLALHVRRRRGDGYHQLETVFAFVDQGDVVRVEVAERDALILSGEFAAGLDAGGDNIVMRALAGLPRDVGWRVHLDKCLPVAAGLGGGSADAGAVFRLAARYGVLPDGWENFAAGLGADVPACVASAMQLGLGTGTELTAMDNDLAGCPVLLVNPRVPLSTGAVFKAWDGADLGPLPHGSAREIAARGRNDLEAAAMGLCPAVGEVLALLRRTDGWLVRMCGSGATCFALFDDVGQR
ncbi:MAG: hypothetical protein RLY97_1375, partial [Pseudomonadota bacterium]